MDIVTDQSLGRDASAFDSPDAFSDLTSVAFTGYEQKIMEYPPGTNDSSVYVFHFDSDLTQSEQDAVRLRLRTSANEEAIYGKALAALAVNSTFLGIASPTNAQTLAQVKRLTQECNSLIRIVLNLYDTTSGT